MQTRLILFALCLSASTAIPDVKKSGKSTAPRIINGEQAKLGQFPWQAALFITGEEGSWFCGGSIVDIQFILTAGHCVDGAISGKVVTGTLDPHNGTESTIEKFFLHENYSAPLIANDIGLIELSQNLTLDDNTKIIKYSNGDVEAKLEVTVSGWGLTHDNDTAISNRLNFLNLITITNEECSQNYSILNDDIVCAVPRSDEIQSTCNGDSGGALVVNADMDIPFQVGVVSFVSDDGCSSGAPSGYTRVGYYKEWLHWTIFMNSL